MVNLGDGVLGPAPRAEAVTARLEVRLEDRLEDQLQGGLHDPVPGGRDAEAAELARTPWGSSVPARAAARTVRALRSSRSCGRSVVVAEDDGARFHSVDSGRPCPPIAPHPMPRHHEEGGIADEVVQVTEPTIRAVGRPLVQLGLHPQYPGLGLFERRATGASVFTGDLLALPVPSAADSLGPFAMWTAFPSSDYYGPSAPPRGHQPTAGLPVTALAGRWGGRPRGGSHVHHVTD